MANKHKKNKSSAVAEMGDCATAKWAKSWKAAVPFPNRRQGSWSLGPYLTQCRLGRGLYLLTYGP